MNKINVVAVGRVKELYFRSGIDEYKKRLSRFCTITEIEIKEEKLIKEGEEEIKRALLAEGEAIKANLKGEIIVLAIEGESVSSEKLSEIVKGAINLGKEITFVIGSSYGLSNTVKTLADKKISFSKMTFPHTLARLVLFEQLYRAFTIITGANYHK